MEPGPLPSAARIPLFAHLKMHYPIADPHEFRVSTRMTTP
jgi:hypothetical protein